MIENQTVLFVDDEQNVLRALQRLCRNEPYKIRVASGGMQALQILADQQIDLVVSDLKMPNQDGTQLLKEVAQRFPDVGRVLMSGNADLPSLVNAVNQGQLSYYFEKPWDDSALKLSIRELLERISLEKSNKALSETIKIQSDKLLEQSAIQKRFFATMSHEIRTPLHGIHGILQILAESSLSADAENLVETALTSTSNLNQIVNDILDFSKIEAGEMILDNSPFSLKKELNQIIELMSPLVTKKSITIELVDPSPTERHWFLGDSSRLRQIMVNLVNNAIKFTHEGGVRISTPSLRSGDVSILIEDTGVGISEQGLKNIFEPYKQSHADRSTVGTGLGLSICRSLAELMSGSISAESSESVGSRFLIKLPLPSSEIPLEEEPQHSEDADLSNLRFLVVDDNPTNRLIVKGLLSSRGAIVEEAGSGEQALALLGKAQHFHTIFMDISMTGIDGLETVQLIKEQNLAPAPTRIIAMSAHVQPSERKRFLDSGMDDFLGKPFHTSELIDTITLQSETKNKMDRTSRNADIAESDTTLKQILEVDILTQLLKEVGPATAPVLINSFIADSLRRKARIVDAISGRDTTELVNQAHALGSSAAMFGAIPLFDACRLLESTGNPNITGGGEPADSETLRALASHLVDEITPAIEAVKTYL